MRNGITTTTLAQVAEINPKLGQTLDGDSRVSFLSMSALIADNTTANNGEERRFADVSKGYTSFLNGDVLVAKITPCFENGKIAQAKLTHEVGFGSTEFHVIRPRSGQSDARYLLHFLRQKHIRLDGERKMTGSAGQRRVPQHFLEDLRIPLPSLAEQRRIAEVLDRAEALRAKRRAAFAQLEALTQSIFFDLFGDPAMNPKGWPVHSLQEVVKHGRIVTYGIVQAGEEYPAGVPYIRTGDIVDGEIVQHGLRHTDPAIAAKFLRSRVEAGEIVISIRATVGTTAVVPPELDGANLTQGTARIAPGSRVDRTYLLYYLRTSGTQHWISLQIKGATFREITLSRLRELPVQVPPMSLQCDFARRIAAVETLRTAHRACLSELNALFSVLQHRAFRGGL